MERDVKKIISQMSLEDKAKLCTGRSFWTTMGFEKYGIPSIMMTDGPHGLRKQIETGDHLGIGESVPATCFPTAVGLASSWNRELVRRVGVALGEECQAEGVQIILGPGANIKRSPLCGRNFEYFSEDPYLSSQIATKHIQGVQSQGVGTSLKHFAVNNQETRRFTIDAVVDERTLREIYLASFEDAVKEGKPWTVMCAYNKLNGEFCSQHKRLLTDILRDEWGFEGFVVSDWGAVSERDKGIATGLDLEMPTSGDYGPQKVVDAVKNGTLSEEALDLCVERLLKIIFKAVDNRKPNAAYDKEAHHRLAREVAAESMVLLKNDGDILPLKKEGKIAVIGAFAKEPRYQGAGSSRINPTSLDIPLDEIRKTAGDAQVTYAEGYTLIPEDNAGELLDAARAAAKEADVAVIFAGLPGFADAEGTDRANMQQPENQNALIDAICEVQPNTVVVLINGSAVEIPWIGKVKGLLEAYLGGQAMAGAVADILFGDVNPSGKLAESFPEKLSHNPSFINFPGDREKVEYREGLFVGYRYYDKVDIKPLLPFGYGLSYTTFEYSDLQLDKQEMLDTDELTVTVRVKNTGNRAGKEIVQLYVSDVESSVLRPVKELKGFEKVDIGPGEEKTVTFKLGKRAFAYYNTELKDWHVESGDFEILIGKSSADIVLRKTVYVKSTVKLPKKYTMDSTLADIQNEPAAAPLFEKMSESLASLGGGGLGMDTQGMMSSISLRMLLMMGRGQVTLEMLNDLLAALNAD